MIQAPKSFVFTLLFGYYCHLCSSFFWQWRLNLDFLYNEYFRKEPYDFISFPLTVDSENNRLFLPLTGKARRLMRGKGCLKTSREIYDFLVAHPEVACTSLR